MQFDHAAVMMRCGLGEFNALEILKPTKQVDGHLVLINAPFADPQVGIPDTNSPS